MVKKQILILFIVVIMLIVYGFFASGYTVNTELPAIKYRLGDEKNYEKIVIRIDGIYQRRIFSADIFKGSIFIEGLEFTNESSGFISLKNTLADIHFDKNGHGFYKYIKVNDNGEIQNLMTGSIYFKDKFEMLTMTIVENYTDSAVGGWNSETGLMISAPAKSRKDALNITNLLMKSNYR